jgi:hypothetical protein
MKQDIPTRQSAVQISRLLMCRKSGYSQPGLSCWPKANLAARQADRQPRLCGIDIDLRGGPVKSRTEAAQSSAL